MRISVHYCGIACTAVLICAALTPSSVGGEQAGGASKDSAPGRPNPFSLAMPPHYREHAVKLMLQEVNSEAKLLNLSEDLPITEQNALEIIVGPPGLAEFVDGAGSIMTPNFHYTLTADFRLKFISPLKFDKPVERLQLKEKCLWPVERVDTNAAHQIAIQSLKLLYADVNALERDCTLTVTFWHPDESDQQHFVPLYFVGWIKDKQPIADVELLEPGHSIRKVSLRPPYILPRTNDLLIKPPKQR